MAKIYTETIVLTFSKIVRESDTDPAPAVLNEHVAALEQVAQELVGDGGGEGGGGGAGGGVPRKCKRTTAVGAAH
jgi:hypothetical protein